MLSRKLLTKIINLTWQRHPLTHRRPQGLSFADDMWQRCIDHHVGRKVFIVVLIENAVDGNTVGC
jgi:hypothetical protein